jgi:hypothetical protein
MLPVVNMRRLCPLLVFFLVLVSTGYSLSWELGAVAGASPCLSYGSYLDSRQATLAELGWPAAVLLSDVIQAPAGYRYNTGGWTSASQGGISYNLGSINIFNYLPALTMFNGTGSVPSSVFYRSSNVYYLAVKSLGSSRTWKIKVPTDVLMSVVIN